jgi:hypothetical protein
MLELDWSDFVLVVCTEIYYKRFRGHEEPAKGKGVDWEGNLITSEIYNTKSKTAKFAPIFFDSQDERFIPEPLRGNTNYLLDSEDNYADLYAFLTNQAGVTPWKIGSLKVQAGEAVEPLTFGDFALDLNHSERWLRSGRPDILEVAMARHQAGEPGLRVSGCGSGTLLEYGGKGLPNIRCHARGLATDEDNRLLLEQAPDVPAMVFDRLLHIGLRFAGLAREDRE